MFFSRVVATTFFVSTGTSWEQNVFEKKIHTLSGTLNGNLWTLSQFFPAWLSKLLVAGLEEQYGIEKMENIKLISFSGDYEQKDSTGFVKT